MSDVHTHTHTHTSTLTAMPFNNDKSLVDSMKPCQRVHYHMLQPALVPAAGLTMIPRPSASTSLQATAKAAVSRAMGGKVKAHAVKKHLKAGKAGNQDHTTWVARPNKWAGKAVDEERPWTQKQWQGQDSQSKADQAGQASSHKAWSYTSVGEAWSYTSVGGKWRSGGLPLLPDANKVVLAQVNSTWNEAEVCEEVTRAAARPRFMLPALGSSPYHQAWVVAFARPEEAACMLQAKSLPQGWMMLPYRSKGRQPASAASEAVEAVEAVEAAVADAVEDDMEAAVEDDMEAAVENDTEAAVEDDMEAAVEEVFSDLEGEVEAEVDPLEEEVMVADFPLADLVLTWPVPASQPGQQVTFLPVGLWQLPPEAKNAWTSWTQKLIRTQVGVLAPRYRPSEGKWPCAVDCRPAGDPRPLPMQSRVHSGLHTKAVMDILADSTMCTHVLLQLQRAWQRIEFADHKVVALVDRTSGHEALSWARILAVVCRHLGYQAHMDCSLVHSSFQPCLTSCAAETASPGFMVIQAVRTWSALLPTYGLGRL